MLLRNKYTIFRHLTTPAQLTNFPTPCSRPSIGVQVGRRIADMSKPTVLLCPPLTHIRNEWEALSSKAILKVRK